MDLPEPLVEVTAREDVDLRELFLRSVGETGPVDLAAARRLLIAHAGT